MLRLLLLLLWLQLLLCENVMHLQNCFINGALFSCYLCVIDNLLQLVCEHGYGSMPRVHTKREREMIDDADDGDGGKHRENGSKFQLLSHCRCSTFSRVIMERKISRTCHVFEVIERRARVHGFISMKMKILQRRKKTREQTNDGSKSGKAGYSEFNKTT